MKTPTNHDDNDADLFIAQAINCVHKKSHGTPLTSNLAITLNFHPDVESNGRNVISQLVEHGTYRSQFETATSNGSLSAHVGGRRWNWESKMFEGAYDSATPSKRPKYGSLNYKMYSMGGALRFGSAHLRLKPHVLERSTFAYPDSHLDPSDFGTQNRMALIELAQTNKTGMDLLDGYIEAHVHGCVLMKTDVDAIVLDPSFKGTSIETSARNLPFGIEWHDGVRLTSTYLSDYLAYRGHETTQLIKQMLERGDFTPASLSRYRDGSVDKQVVKKVWHCMARFGGV